jgi:hypothetical protein
VAHCPCEASLRAGIQELARYPSHSFTLQEIEGAAYLLCFVFRRMGLIFRLYLAAMPTAIMGNYHAC